MFNSIKKKFTCPEIDRFEGVDFETFISLDSDAIKEVIPEVIPRLNFITQYKDYLHTTNLETINESEIISNLIIVDHANNETVRSLHLESFKDQSATGVLSTSEINVTGESFNYVRNSNESLNQISSAVPSITSPQDIIDIPSIELKIIIKRFSQKCLDNSDRVMVGKEIIRHLLLPNPERVISREEFQQIAENIVKLFPNEIAGCYYTASQGLVQAQGKLYTAYSKLKARLRDAGLIAKRPKSKPVKEASTGMAFNNTVQSRTALKFMSVSTSELASIEMEFNDPVQLETALNFLSVETDDFEKVKHYWIMSHKLRSAVLQSKSTTLDYINMFPVFNQAKGYELLSIDATIKFPNMESKLLEVSEKVLLFASGLQNCSLDVNILTNEFNCYKENSSLERRILEVQQQLIALKLIPRLLHRTEKRKREAEATVSFYTSYKSIAEAEQMDKNTARTLPYLNMIGESTIPVSQIVISGKKFVIDDPIAGFDLLFKSYLALSLNYPDECKHIWLFVQQSVYNVHRNSDLKLNNVTTFINDISNVSDE